MVKKTIKPEWTKLNSIQKMMMSSNDEERIQNDFRETNTIIFAIRHFYFNGKKLSESIPKCKKTYPFLPN